MAPRLFVYKLSSDTGAAPCVHDGVLTLAICKPMIRSSAQVGDLLFGFAADSLSPDNRLIYIARVTAIEEEYYDDPDYAGRPDRIYLRGEDGRFRVRSGARFHEDGTLIERDIGAFPEYDRARVLVSDDFRYFGSSGRPVIGLRKYPAVLALVRRLKQGHRLNHPPEVERELWHLQRAAWGQSSSDGAPEQYVEGKPRAPAGRRC